MGLFNYLEGNDRYQKDILTARVDFVNDQQNRPAMWPLVNETEFSDIIKVYGYQKDIPTPYSAVLYKANNIISIFKIRTNDDIISFGFSGCRLIKFQVDSDLYAAHVPPKQNKVWERFVNQFNSTVIMSFEPIGERGQSLLENYPAYRCWGIIENNSNKCYSLTVFENIKCCSDTDHPFVFYTINQQSKKCLML